MEEQEMIDIIVVLGLWAGFVWVYQAIVKKADELDSKRGYTYNDQQRDLFKAIDRQEAGGHDGEWLFDIKDDDDDDDPPRPCSKIRSFAKYKERL